MKPVFHKRALQNRLDFFTLFRLQDRKQLLVWVFVSIGVVVMTLLVLVSTSLVIAHGHAVLREKQTFLDKKVALLQSRAKNKNVALVGVLRTVSEVISTHTYLDSILYEDGSTEIEGRSCQVSQAVNFCKKLSESGVLNNCQWTYVQQDGLFTFRIRGKAS